VLELSAAAATSTRKPGLLEQLREDASQPFELSSAPLIRARLLSLPNEAHVLVFNMHHIVSDGWSVSVLAGEVAALYRAFGSATPTLLPELPIQYVDYAIWQREHLSGVELDRQLNFWRAELAGAPFRLELPRKPRVLGHSYAGATVQVVIELEQATRIDALAVELNATPFMVLLAAWAALLSRVCGQADLIIGSPWQPSAARDRSSDWPVRQHAGHPRRLREGRRSRGWSLSCESACSAPKRTRACLREASGRAASRARLGTLADLSGDVCHAKHPGVGLQSGRGRAFAARFSVECRKVRSHAQHRKNCAGLRRGWNIARTSSKPRSSNG